MNMAPPTDEEYLSDLNSRVALHPESFAGQITEKLLALHRRSYPIDTHFDAISGCYQFGADFGADEIVLKTNTLQRWLAIHIVSRFIPQGLNLPLNGHANREGFLLGMGGAVSCAHANPQNLIGNLAGDPWPIIVAESQFLDDEILNQNDSPSLNGNTVTRRCKTSKEVRDCKKAGLKSLIFGLEGAHSLGKLPSPHLGNHAQSQKERLDNLVTLKREFGACYLTLDHFCATDASTAGIVGNRFLPWSPRTKVLTDFGYALVNKVIDLGLLLDVAHTEAHPLQSACEIAKKRGVPVIATHSGSKTITAGMEAKTQHNTGSRCNIDNRRTNRMLDDASIKAIVETGGCIGVIIGTQFLVNMRYFSGRPANDAPLCVFLEHYEKLANIIRHLCPDVDPWDHLCFGTDFDGALASIPWEIRGAYDLPLITLAMLERGWSEERIEKVYSENFLRVWEQAELGKI